MRDCPAVNTGTSKDSSYSVDFTKYGVGCSKSNNESNSFHSTILLPSQFLYDSLDLLIQLIALSD